jgi:hypothetical protein
MSFTLWQIWYAEKQKSEIYSFATPYYNEGLTIYFESSVIAKLVPTSETEYTSVCSWKLAQKSRRIHPITPEALGSDYQVLSFTRNGRDHKMISMATNWHPEFLPAIKLLWEKLGLKMPGEARNPIYQNAYAAKTSIYKRYVTDFLVPAMNLVENDEELRSMMLKDSNYVLLSRESDIKSVKSKLGIDFYPLCPFIFERCPSLWFQMHNTPVRYL